MIQLHRLEGFYWVAKLGGYARAARDFPYPITQPALHQQVKKLETELDRSLLERVAKDRMTLTPAGRLLFEFVEPFFVGLDAVVRAVRTDEHGGELEIWAEPLLMRRLLPQWLRRLQLERPNTKIGLRELATSDFEPLRRGEADLLVGYLPDPPADIAFQEVARVLPFLVLPTDHPKAQRKRLSIRDLRHEPFIAYHRGDVAHAFQLEALARHDVSPEQMLFASSADTILGFVASGLGYSLVPTLDPAGDFGLGIASRPLTRLARQFPVYAAWRRDAPENVLLDAALETAPKPGDPPFQLADRSVKRP